MRTFFHLGKQLPPPVSVPVTLAAWQSPVSSGVKAANRGTRGETPARWPRGQTLSFAPRMRKVERRLNVLKFCFRRLSWLPMLADPPHLHAFFAQRPINEDR